MVDGFGSSKTEGVFRRCAEQALRVLRENREIIMTVLEVFKYDPLHSWALNPVKKLRLQAEQQKVPATPISETGTMFSNMGGSDLGVVLGPEKENVDDDCERALDAVRSKLDGNLSIEYTVNELIVSARDETKLAIMWPGTHFHSSR